MFRVGRKGKFLGIIVVLTIILMLVARPTLLRYENLLGGMWVGDPGFLKKSGLSDMQLFVSPTGGRQRQGYLIMTDTNGEFIANQALELECRFGIFRSVKAFRNHFRPGHDTMSGSVRITIDEGENIESPFPPDLKMAISLAEGSMTLFNDQKVFAYLYRDPVASHAAEIAYDEA